MKIVVINEKEMRSIMSMKDAISAVKEAAANYSAGKTDIPLRANLNVKEYNGDSLYMYGYVPGSKALGVKLVSVYPDNPKKGINACPATVILENAETGEANAIIDGTYLTRLRTGALSGAATVLLSRNDSQIFALIGTGELGDLVDGKYNGRENSDELTFFETTGSAVFDLVTGQKIYEMALKKNLGKIIEL